MQAISDLIMKVVINGMTTVACWRWSIHTDGQISWTGL